MIMFKFQDCFGCSPCLLNKDSFFLCYDSRLHSSFVHIPNRLPSILVSCSFPLYYVLNRPFNLDSNSVNTYAAAHFNPSSPVSRRKAQGGLNVRPDP